MYQRKPRHTTGLTGRSAWRRGHAVLSSVVRSGTTGMSDKQATLSVYVFWETLVVTVFLLSKFGHSGSEGNWKQVEIQAWCGRRSGIY